MILKYEDYIRYDRHLLLKEISTEGQCKLKNAKILIIGVGGLGSPIAIYLAAVGIGTLGIVENDIVDLSNIQRQILYSTEDVGKSKAKIAKEVIKKNNPDCEVNVYEERLTKGNILEIISKYDYVVDATDNLETRYLINDACVLLDKTYVYGSVQGFNGQVTVLASKEGPCYRCLFPEPPKRENVQGGLEKGILGTTPGIIGILQATEIIKLVCNIGTPLIGRMLYYDALDMTFTELSLNKNEKCKVCGENRIEQLGDYSEFKNLEPETVGEISLEELFSCLTNLNDFMFLDVRDECEYKEGHIKNFINIPISHMNEYIKEIKNNREKNIIIACEYGERSLIAAKALCAKGFRNVKILSSGISQWKRSKYSI